VGLVEQSHVQVLRRQLSLSHSSITYYAMLGQVICGWILFGCIRLREAARINLFGVVIHNDTLADALNWFSQSAGNGCRTAFFINVNSLNIAYKSPEFRAVLNTADKLFADGSGVRLGAMRSGNRLRANINGTDLLPHLCEQCVASSRSIFLLGAEPGVVDIAAAKLKKQHSGLQIAGVHHGYFDISQSAKMIERINQSGATFLLVGFGSPLQENWVLKNAAALRCDYVLAVGGLFDFVAGKFSRAPLWLRAIGMEWIWRLLQDPATKFSRYVLGNPLFIYRLLFKLHQ
jgi:exopolysaccharide biosynthesis WecB/TagA/CpsF family protein